MFRLAAIQAAVLRVKLPHLTEWSAARRANAVRYRALFDEAGLDEVTLPVEAPNRTHIYNQFVIRVPDRDRLKQHLDKAGKIRDLSKVIPDITGETISPKGLAKLKKLKAAQ